MNYPETLEYLFAQLPMFHRVGAHAYKANLDNTLALCQILDNPHNSFKSVHVTGTNGKGSVSHMLASILQEAGFRTGLYTSPHLKDFRERIRVNGKMIEKRYVTSFVQKYREQYELFQPSFFELTVGLAFDYFRAKQVEIAVVEAGLGGRLDSTNILTPLMSVITNVSFDHMQFLGDTHAKIAVEKAGIIKPGIPVVIGETQPDTESVFLKKARETGSEITFADQHLHSGAFEFTGKSGTLRSMDVLRGPVPHLKHLKSPLTGNYQRKNILTVIWACEQLNKIGFHITIPMVRKGVLNVIANTGLAGRWQILGRNPLTVCDTGHNEGGLREVLAQIEETPHNRLHFVFGVVNDKHLPPIFELLPRNATYYFCKPDIPRGLDAKELQQAANKVSLAGSCYPSVKAALKAAQRAATAKDLVFVGGSTFVVAEVV